MVLERQVIKENKGFAAIEVKVCVLSIAWGLVAIGEGVHGCCSRDQQYCETGRVQC